jgi:hypothetical protein
MSARERVIYQVTAHPGCPRVARGIVAGELSGLIGPAALDTVRLLISELVAQRVLTVRREEPMTLDLENDNVVRCTVRDRGAPSFPTGLRSVVLDALADRWGVTCTDRYTETWFEAEVLSG